MCGDTHGGVRLHGRVGDDLLLLALDQHVQKRGAAPVRRLKDGAFKKVYVARKQCGLRSSVLHC